MLAESGVALTGIRSRQISTRYRRSQFLPERPDLTGAADRAPLAFRTVSKFLPRLSRPPDLDRRQDSP